MPITTVSPRSFRAEPEESEFVNLALPRSVLEMIVPGENTIAVEVHQASRSSGDVSFDLRLNANFGRPNDVRPGINRLKIRAFDDAGRIA